MKINENHQYYNMKCCLAIVFMFTFRPDYCCYCSVGKSWPTLQPHGLQHTRPPCPAPSLRVCQSSCPLNQTWLDTCIIFFAICIFFWLTKKCQFHKRKMSFLQIKTSLQVFFKKYQVYKFYKIINFSFIMHSVFLSA